MAANAILRTQTIRPENAAEFVHRYLSDNVMYCAIGRETNPIGVNPDTGSAYVAGDGNWSNGTDVTVDLVSDTYHGDAIFRSMIIGAQKLKPEDIFLVVPYEAASNFFSSTESDYTSSRDFQEIYTSEYLTNGNFYLVNDNNEVFICLKSGASKATNIPKLSGVLTSDNAAKGYKNGFLDDDSTATDAETSIVDNSATDGYVWKYMYTIKRNSSFDKKNSFYLPVNFAVNTQKTGTTPTEMYSSSQDRHTGPTGVPGTAYRIMGARYVYMESKLSAGADTSLHDKLPINLQYRQTALVSNPATKNHDPAVANVILAKNSVNDNDTYAIADDIKIVIDKGDIFYIENHPLINRLDGQTETFNTVISF